MRLSISTLFSVITAIFTFSLLTARPALAGHVEKVKDDQVLIVQDDSEPELNPGDRFYVLVDGKKRAAIQVTKAKGRRGIAKLLKGKPEVNGILVAVADAGGSRAGSAGGSSAAAASDAPKKRRPKDSPLNSTSWGALIGMNQATQSVSVQAASGTVTSFSTAGTGFNLKAFADVPLSGGLGMLGRFGFEQFNASGSGATTSILYGTADLLVRYNFLSSSFSPFVSGGLGLHVPLSKSSTDLDASQISATTLLFLGVGANYIISNKMYAQLMFEYCYFPPSSNVTTTLYALRLGLGWRY